ncbi:MAG: hypothetical protein WCK35_29915 [Chloroflexota bacterium]
MSRAFGKTPRKRNGKTEITSCHSQSRTYNDYTRRWKKAQLVTTAGVILKECGVEGLLSCSLERQEKHTLGWQVTNNDLPSKHLTLEPVVLTYRDEYIIEPGPLLPA